MRIPLKYYSFLILGLFLFSSNVNNIHAQNLVITEIMYNLPGPDTLEYIELYNNSSSTINLNGYHFVQGIVYTFPQIMLPAGDFLIVAADSARFVDAFGVPARQWTSGGLNNAGEDIVIYTASNLFADSVNYLDISPWPTGPVSPDGGGASIVLCNPNLDNNIAGNWIAATEPTGVFVMGIELLAHPGAGCPDTDLSPPIPFLAEAISSTQVSVCFNEPVNESAENVSNYSGLGTVLSATLNGTSDKVILELLSSLPDGVPVTFTVSNVEDLAGNAMTNDTELTILWSIDGPIRNLVITEIMYNPPDTGDVLEYIEIYNNSGLSRQLDGVHFSEGVTFTFPNFTFNPGEYIVVAKDAFSFNQAFGFTPFQWNTGSLNNAGETIAISDPIGALIDIVNYGDSGNPAWPAAADGTGTSMVLCNVNSDNNIGSNWLAASTLSGVLVNGVELLANPGSGDPQCPTAVSGIPSFIYRMYPNPTQGQVIIELGEGEYLIRVFDLAGRPLLEEKIFSDTWSHHFGDLPNGIVLIQMLRLDKPGVIWEKLLITD